LETFVHLDPLLILHSWMEDLVQKDQLYRNLQLFTREEEKRLYEENQEDRFKGTLLLRKGTITTLLIQFYHLQDFIKDALKEKRVLHAIDLLPCLLTLHDMQKQTLSYVHGDYKNAKEKISFPKERLQKALNRDVRMSLTSAQSDGISFGKPPLFEEIQQREEYAPEKAQEELFAFTLKKCAEGVSIGKSLHGTWINANFKRMKNDPARQSLVLQAITFLIQRKNRKPNQVTLAHCSVLNKVNLTPFLHPNLIYLNLSGSSIKEDAIQEIERLCPKLVQLYLNHCNELSSFEKQASLLTSTYLDFPHLETLQIRKCSKLVSIYLEAPKLKELKADKNPLLKKLFLKPIALYLKGNCLNCPDLDLDKNKREGAKRYFSELRVRNVDSKYLIQLFMNDQNLHEFNLFNKGVDTKGAKAIAEALASNSSLTELHLKFNKIGNEGAKAIAQVLASNSSLTKLDFEYNGIGDEGAKAIAEALNSNSSLTKLNLSYNKISDEGAKAIAQALNSNSSLTKLDFVYNGIGDEGAKAIARALASNSSLTELDLKSNNIGDEGVKALEEYKNIVRL
jgi:NLR family CARD domain-containing protein 3